MKGFYFLIAAAIILIIVLPAGLTNYKSETLFCSKTQNECHVERINLFGIKSRKKIIKYSDIKTVSYIRQKIKGNLYARGYTDYQLIFISKNNARKIIFSEIYFEYPQIARKIREIRHELKKGTENFTISK